ncbi:MAG: MBL fold metallo-hydrolase RNA specificity domain-containing protein [Verrucomicrobiales bacterium]
MRLTFCGAAGTTTGSQHLLEVDGQRILLDCGLYQGKREDALERNRHFRFDPASLDAVVLSHAHIDHSGNLPNLSRQGYRGNIYCTFATRDLCQIMLADSARIQQSDIDWLNKHRSRRNEPPLAPLYSPPDAEKCLRQFVTFDYHRKMTIANGVDLTFIDAGHLLGAAQVILDVTEDGHRRRFLFSGDVGRGDDVLLRDPEVAEEVDFVLMESTYGGREHELSPQAHERIEGLLKKALHDCGKVIIPAFAVERTQQLIYVLNHLLDQGRLPPVPIFVDSPLAVDATEIFRLHPECFNEEVYEFLFKKRNPFHFEGLSLIRSVEQSKALNQLKQPAIIIAASGMCEAGRVLHHLKNNLADPCTTVLFVGYCAEQTLGWKLREGFREVNVLGERVKVRARIEALDSFSGHADHSELLGYYERMTGRKEQTWLVHGAPERSEAFKNGLRERFQANVHVATLGQSIDW